MYQAIIPMTDILFNLPTEENFSLNQTCRNQDQPWVKMTVQTELEIDQLLTILADLLKQPHYRRLQHRAVDYFNALSQLKSRFRRLRLTMTCGMACLAQAQEPCFKPRISEYTTKIIDSQLQILAESLNRTRSGCYLFLSRLVTLNLF